MIVRTTQQTCVLIVLCLGLGRTEAWIAGRPLLSLTRLPAIEKRTQSNSIVGRHFSSTEKQQQEIATASSSSTAAGIEDELVYDYEEPEDAVIHIKPLAMNRLRELRAQQFQQGTPTGSPQYLVLRMGVRNGGCSGMSYVMDFDKVESINEEDDTVDTYEGEKIQCVVDSKSLLYLYGLELDYSNELVGGGFRFKNPNAEESCGCGSSFAV